MGRRRHARRRRRAARPASERPERQQDPRLITTRAIKVGGEDLPPGHWVTVVSPVNLPDGRRLMWHPPQAVAFNLVQAKTHQDRGSSLRRSILGNLTVRDGGGYMPQNSGKVMDCIGDLSAAVLFAFTGVESLANHAIEMLPEDFLLERKGRSIRRDELAQTLGIDDKLKLVMPEVEGGKHIAGDARIWERYKALKFLRDELLHVKRRGYSPDPDEPSEYDRLMLGEADHCVEDAVAVIEGAWPGFLPDYVQSALTPD